MDLTTNSYRSNLDTGNLVFAKIRGYPYWPAEITSLNKKGKVIKYNVCFFGDHETATLPKECIIVYNKLSKEKYGKIKQQSFQNSMEEIENIETCFGVVQDERTKKETRSVVRLRHLSINAKILVGVCDSKIHKQGLHCKRAISQDQMVIEFKGDRITNTIADKRDKMYESRGIGIYMYRIDEDTVIDATMNGNVARFINHSCDPNCKADIVYILGKSRIIIFALNRIEAGAELTCDYNLTTEGKKISCTCGAKQCKGYIN